MNRKTIAAALLVGAVLASASPAWAQSAIAGVVKDSTGLVLPGVIVEASSDVLIEKVRTAITDGQGQYRIIDLRPGTYVVVFTLTGFNTYRQEGLELPSSFTATVNADLRVGALEEAIIVTGDTPVVDTRTATTTQVISRDVWDTLPSARNVQAVAQLMPGVRMNQSDVGGSQAMQQQQFLVRGITGGNNTVSFDGMNLNSLLGDGATVPYFNDATIEEFSFQAGALGADTTAGGGRVSVIPKDGGNRFSGSGFAAYNGESWQSDNFTQELRDAGLDSSGAIVRMYDFNGSFGGPLKKDRIWFLFAARQYAVDNLIPGVPIIDDQYIKVATGRLTFQVSPRNKISIHHDRMYKWRGHRYEPPQVFLEERASRIHDNPLYYWGVVKWTSTISPRLLLEVGQTHYFQPNTMRYQPGIRQEPFSPGWYTNASRTDRDLATIWVAPATSTRSTPERYSWQGAVSYVTGSHHFTTGGNWAWGRQRTFSESHGDLQQEYRSGVPDTVLLRNSPIDYADAKMIADVGIFAQDSWTLKRLTITGGVRYEYFDAMIPEQSSPAGRFVGARHFAAIDHLPQFTDVVPRLSGVYDLFGTGKTAIKANVSKYVDQRTLSLTTPYSPLAAVTARVSWRDLNGDDVAQGELGCVYLTPGCEFQVSALPQNFGTRALSIQDPDLKRPTNLETSVAVQHELMPRLSVSAGYYRRSFQDLLLTDFVDRSQADYTPVPVVSPLDGEVITAYNLAPSKLLLTRTVDTNATSDRKQTFNGYEFAVNARVRGGVTVFGGLSFQKTVRVTCDQPDDPNLLRFCDQGEVGLPTQYDFKLNISYPTPLWDIYVSGVYQNYQGAEAQTNWLISRTTRYAADCVGPCTPGALVVPAMTEASLTIPLKPVGIEFLDRLNQLDIRVGKRFRVHRMNISTQVDIFNALNGNAVLGVRNFNYGVAGFGVPSEVLQARLLKVSASVNF
jgi:Carboxypeptidase regulatory-like domain/TonB-dependent Receptor Plug Domain